MINSTAGTAGSAYILRPPPFVFDRPEVGLIERTIKIIGVPMAYALSLTDGIRQVIRNSSDGYVVVYSVRGSIAGKMAHLLSPGCEVGLLWLGNRWEIR